MGSLPTTLELPVPEGVVTARSHLSATEPISPVSLFKSIPPERIGLNGEYDHSGLAKRVNLAFRQNFSTLELQHLAVAQRGCVVILRGQVTRQIVSRLIAIAAATYGTCDVETKLLQVVE